jgi:hypothetical protein
LATYVGNYIGPRHWTSSSSVSFDTLERGKANAAEEVGGWDEGGAREVNKAGKGPKQTGSLARRWETGLVVLKKGEKKYQTRKLSVVVEKVRCKQAG